MKGEIERELDADLHASQKHPAQTSHAHMTSSQKHPKQTSHDHTASFASLTEGFLREAVEFDRTLSLLRLQNEWHTNLIG